VGPSSTRGSLSTQIAHNSVLLGRAKCLPTCRRRPLKKILRVGSRELLVTVPEKSAALGSEVTRGDRAARHPYHIWLRGPDLSSRTPVPRLVVCLSRSPPLVPRAMARISNSMTPSPRIESVPCMRSRCQYPCVSGIAIMLCLLNRTTVIGFKLHKGGNRHMPSARCIVEQSASASRVENWKAVQGGPEPGAPLGQIWPGSSCNEDDNRGEKVKNHNHPEALSARLG